MAGHSKWKQIKHKKEKADQSRGQLFSKLARNIAIAARGNPDPKFNPSLRSAIDQAKRHNMPQANIERAIKRAGETGETEELLVEIYGPGGVGLLVRGQTDNRNRTLGEIKNILKAHNARLAEPGSLMWAFEQQGGDYRPKFPDPDQPPTVVEKIKTLAEELGNQGEVIRVYTSLGA